MNPKELISGVKDLYSPSPGTMKLVSLLTKPEVDHNEIIQAVQLDVILSAKLLALCNSAAMGFASVVSSVDQAVLLLGQREISRLALSLSFGETLTRKLPGYAIEPEALRQHALMTALVTGPVVQALPVGDVDAPTAYTAGLVHDIGKIVLDQALEPAVQEQIRALIQQGQCALVEAEQSIIGCDHAQVGACLLEQWKLPEVIIEAVANHHRPILKPKPKLSAIVHIADMLAHQVGASPGWASYAIRAGEESVEALGLSPEVMENLMIAAFDAQASVEELAQAV